MNLPSENHDDLPVVTMQSVRIDPALLAAVEAADEDILEGVVLGNVVPSGSYVVRLDSFAPAIQAEGVNIVLAWEIKYSILGDAAGNTLDRKMTQRIYIRSLKNGMKTVQMGIDQLGSLFVAMTAIRLAKAEAEANGAAATAVDVTRLKLEAAKLILGKPAQIKLNAANAALTVGIPFYATINLRKSKNPAYDDDNQLNAGSITAVPETLALALGL